MSIKNLYFEDKFFDVKDSHKFSIDEMKKDKNFLTGEAEFRNEFGELLLKRKNLVLLRGRTFALEKIFNQYLKSTPPAYNAETGTEVSPKADRKVCLFSIGIGGCGNTFGSTYPPVFNNLDLANKIPFRYVPTGTPLSGADASKYFGKVVGSSHDAYYYKVFENNPIFTWGGLSGLEDEVYISMSLKISIYDVREYFIANGGLQTARVNELGLYFGYQASPSSDYSEVEMFSRLTFENEPLISDTRELNILYRIYSS